mmetsp:Transcript_8997/g.17899  ORF Transcript_8997/g.17899 Transcript_8997/m.17899 type:complete len:246 (-) Transcript_8997:1088-1825(-)
MSSPPPSSSSSSPSLLAVLVPRGTWSAMPAIMSFSCNSSNTELTSASSSSSSSRVLVSVDASICSLVICITWFCFSKSLSIFTMVSLCIIFLFMAPKAFVVPFIASVIAWVDVTSAMRSDTACSCDLSWYSLVTAPRFLTMDFAVTFAASSCCSFANFLRSAMSAFSCCWSCSRSLSSSRISELTSRCCFRSSFFFRCALLLLLEKNIFIYLQAHELGRQVPQGCCLGIVGHFLGHLVLKAAVLV